MAPNRRRGGQPGNTNAFTHGRTTRAQKKLTALLVFVSHAYPGGLADLRSLPEPIQLALLRLGLDGQSGAHVKQAREARDRAMLLELGLADYKPGDLQRFIAETQRKRKTKNESAPSPVNGAGGTLKAPTGGHREGALT